MITLLLSTRKSGRTRHYVFGKNLKNSKTKSSRNEGLIRHQILMTTRKSLQQELSMTKMFFGHVSKRAKLSILNAFIVFVVNVTIRKVITPQEKGEVMVQREGQMVLIKHYVIIKVCPHLQILYFFQKTIVPRLKTKDYHLPDDVIGDRKSVV